MAPHRPTPSPPPSPLQCAQHSGLYERVRDLEGRQTAASAERAAMKKEIVDMRIEQAKATTRWSIVVIVANALIAVAIAVAVKTIVGG